MKQVKVWSVAVSLGGVESIVSVPQAGRTGTAGDYGKPNPVIGGFGRSG